MTDVYRLAVGTLTKAALQANSAYIVANFTNTAPRGVWAVETTGIIEAGSQRILDFNGNTTYLGDIKLPPWIFLATRTQTAYLNTTVLGALPSRAVTIQTFDIYRNLWRCFNAIMHQPDFEEMENLDDTHLSPVTFKFTKAVEAAAS